MFDEDHIFHVLNAIIATLSSRNVDCHMRTYITLFFDPTDKLLHPDSIDRHIN